MVKNKFLFFVILVQQRYLQLLSKCIFKHRLVTPLFATEWNIKNRFMKLLSSLVTLIAYVYFYTFNFLSFWLKKFLEKRILENEFHFLENASTSTDTVLLKIKNLLNYNRNESIRLEFLKAWSLPVDRIPLNYAILYSLYNFRGNSINAY